MLAKKTLALLVAIWLFAFGSMPDSSPSSNFSSRERRRREEKREFDGSSAKGSTADASKNVNAVQTRRDRLVQNLLEERRWRLNEKLQSSSSIWDEDAPMPHSTAQAWNAASQGHESCSSAPNAVAGPAGPAIYGDLWSSPDVEGSSSYNSASKSRGHEERRPSMEYTFGSPTEVTRSPGMPFTDQGSQHQGSCRQNMSQALSQDNPRFPPPLQSNSSHGSPVGSRPSSSADGSEPKSTPTVTRQNPPVAKAKSPAAGQSCGRSRGRLATAKSKSSPNIQSQPRPRSAPARSSAEARARRSGNEFHTVVQEWGLRHKASLARRTKEREEQEKAEMQHCTFKPSIGTRSEFYARRSRGCLLEPLASRLHHEADQRECLRQKAKELLEKDEMCNYTFKPQINTDRGSSLHGRSAEPGQGDHKPLHLRLDEIQKSRKEHLDAMQAEAHLHADCTFQPRISQGSEKIIVRKREDAFRALDHQRSSSTGIRVLGPVEERLYQEAKEIERRRTALEDRTNDMMQVPSISIDSQSEKICKSSVYFQGAQQEFLTRQQTFEAVRNRRKQLRTQHADAECSFQPKVSHVSQQLVASNVEFMGETLDDKVNRLAVRDVERRNDTRDALEQLHYKDCSFRPSINPLSQLLGRKEQWDQQSGTGSQDEQGSVHDRLYTCSQNKQISKPGYEESQLAACTFKPSQAPASTKKYAHVRPRYSGNGKQLMKGIQDDLRKRDEYLQDKREEQAEHEKAECTFHPKRGARAKSADADRSRNDRPVIVSGLGRFFELRDLSRRQQEEQQIREQRVFKPPDQHNSTARLTGVTIPQPFKLSTAQKEECPRVAKLRDKLEEELKNQCTFKPVTVESKKRELVRQMLMDSEDLWS